MRPTDGLTASGREYARVVIIGDSYKLAVVSSSKGSRRKPQNQMSMFGGYTEDADKEAGWAKRLADKEADCAMFRLQIEHLHHDLKTTQSKLNDSQLELYNTRKRLRALEEKYSVDETADEIMRGLKR